MVIGKILGKIMDISDQNKEKEAEEFENVGKDKYKKPIKFLNLLFN